MLEQADVVCHSVSALSHGAEAVQNPAVHLPGVGLAANREGLFKAELPGDPPVHLVDFGPVSLKEVQEAGLRAGGPSASQEFQVLQHKVQLLQVRQEILHPEGGPLAHRDQLGGLIVGVAQGRGVRVLPGELREVPQQGQKALPEIPQALTVEDEVGVVGDIAAGGPQVDDARGGGRGRAVGVDVGHHVMPDFLFPPGSQLEVDVGEMVLQLLHLFRRHGQAQLMLRPGQGHPQPPPGLDAGFGGEEVQHELRRIAGGEGGFVAVLTHRHTS